MSEESRRSFLHIPELGKFINSVRSGHEDEARMVRILDEITEHGSELGIIAAMVAMAAEAAKDRYITVAITPTETWSHHGNELQQVQGKIGQVTASYENALARVRSLSQLWRSRYHKSRTEAYTVPVETCTGTGKSQTCSTHLETRYKTVWYWDEPQDLTQAGINHDVFDRQDQWLSTRLYRSRVVIKNLPNSPYQLQSDEDYDFTQTAADRTTTNHARLAVVGLGALGYTIYENVLGWLASRNDLPDDIRRLGSTDIKRRSILKMFGAFLAALSMNDLRVQSLTNNSQLLSNMRQVTKNEVALAIDDADDARGNKPYIKALGESIASTVESAQASTQLAETGLGTSTVQNDQELRSFLADTQQSFHNLNQELRKFSNYHGENDFGIDRLTAKALNMSSTNARIQGQLNSKNLEGVTDTLRQVFAYLSILFGSAISIEFASHVTDMVLDGIGYQSELR